MPLASFPNGLGATLGSGIVTAKPALVRGQVWYVDDSGTDAASPAGLDRKDPLATLGQALTNASAGDMIVLMDGHAETFTGAVTPAANVTIVGEGQSDGKPTVKLTNNQATSGGLFTISNSGVELHNIWIEENSNATANSTARITVTADYFRMFDCYVECGTKDDGPAITFASGGDKAWIGSTTFISTSTDGTDQPPSAVHWSAAISDLTIDGCVFDDGTVGFSTTYAIDGDAANLTRFRFRNLSLLRGADITLTEASTGYYHLGTYSQSSRVVACDIGGA